MRVRMHIKEGVARGLCGTCSEAHITVDDRGQQMVYCTALYNSIRIMERPIHHCTSYEARNTGMDRHEAEKIGWIMEVRKGNRGEIGFARPKRKVDSDD
jgi:hypothetical protein